MRLFRKGDRRGASNVEILILLIIIGLLSGLILATHHGIEEKQHNIERQRDIDELRVELEAYFSQYQQYPTLADMNNPSWRQFNMKALNKEVLRDPGGSSYTLNGFPDKNIYSYHVTAANGKACDDDKNPCTEYTLTATLEGGGTYFKKNL